MGNWTARGPAAGWALCTLRSVVTERSSWISPLSSPSFPSSSSASFPTRQCSRPLSWQPAAAQPWCGWRRRWLLVHVIIAVTIGVALFHLLPHQVLDAVVAGMFLLGAALALREAVKSARRRRTIEKEVASHRKVAVTAFLVIFLAEWGDLTQILTANLAAHYHDPLSVAVGATLALWAVAGLAVVSGQSVLRLINISTIRIVTAVVLVVLAGWAAWSAAH